MAVLQIIAKSTAMSLFYAVFVLLVFTYFGVLKIHVLLSVSRISYHMRFGPSASFLFHTAEGQYAVGYTHLLFKHQTVQ